MKTATFPRRGPRFPLRSLCIPAFCVAVAGLQAQAEAESVDSEILLLVDVTPRGLNRSEFDQVMESYASAMTSSQVLNSIQSGAYGRIAVSLMFYGNSFTQQVGIPWMSIGTAAEAEQFATLAREAVRPFSIGSPAIGDALQAATISFGSETGGASNGFESTVQIIEVAAATRPIFGNPADVAGARDAALASGVDLINAITLGNGTDMLEAYYASNVVGGEAGGVVATSNAFPVGGGLPGAMATQMSNGVGAGAAVSLSSVPEPSSALALLSSLSLLLIRRRC